MTELAYRRGTRSADEIQREIDRFWTSLDNNDGLRDELADAGLDLREIPAGMRPEAIRVSTRGAGLDPSSVTLVVAFAPAANAVLISLWQHVLLPRVRARFGRDAILDEKSPTP